MTEPQSGSRQENGLLDTSVFIARESGRPLGTLPDAAAISVVTIAELHLGVLMADDAEVRARRLRTLSAIEEVFEPLAITSRVARAFAELAARARRENRRTKILDLWIAATAVAHDLSVYTQDTDFEAMAGVAVVLV